MVAKIASLFETPDGHQHVKEPLDQIKYFLRMLDELERKLELLQ